MECPECEGELREIELRVDNEKSLTYKFKSCNYFSFCDCDAAKI